MKLIFRLLSSVVLLLQVVFFPVVVAVVFRLRHYYIYQVGTLLCQVHLDHSRLEAIWVTVGVIKMQLN